MSMDYGDDVEANVGNMCGTFSKYTLPTVVVPTVSQFIYSVAK